MYVELQISLLFLAIKIHFWMYVDKSLQQNFNKVYSRLLPLTPLKAEA